MIPISRGPEPGTLTAARQRHLPDLRAIAATRRPLSHEITGYEIVAQELWRAQHQKCCYCEFWEQSSYNDVEHYRPKATADRSPGCADHHGYWWLAHRWENLLFSCAECNRSRKRVRFPLDAGSRALLAEEMPPGNERPLLIDPTTENAVEHIQFHLTSLTPPGKPVVEQWIPRPRSGSRKGEETIKVCGLDRDGLVEPYERYVTLYVKPAADALLAALKQKQFDRSAWHAALRLLQPEAHFVGLAYDALRHFVVDAELAKVGLKWPSPAEVGVTASGAPAVGQPARVLAAAVGRRKARAKPAAKPAKKRQATGRAGRKPKKSG